MTTATQRTRSSVFDARFATALDRIIGDLNHWLVTCDYAGHEPYDLLNSPYLHGWAQRQPFATFFIQSGKRVGGLALRRVLRVSRSRNPKALGLILAAYCELARCGWDTSADAGHVKQLLLGLRSPDETGYCWGYDWHYVSLRGARLPAFSPNSIATVFCAQALLDHAETFHDRDSRSIALSAADWLAHRLNRSVENEHQLCLSYTPHDRARIINNNALMGALFARIAVFPGLAHYGETARKLMQFVASGQSADGSWSYGLGRAQRWIDGFHTGYNLCALLDYQRLTGDESFADTVVRGYNFYRQHFFRADGAPRYFHNRTFPIDIHSCSQAILTFCAFTELDPTALRRAENIARWTCANLRNPDGSFGYQLHRTWKDRTPYVRWSQAWMLRALATLRQREAGLA